MKKIEAVTHRLICRLKFTAEKMVAEELSEANVGMAKMLIAQYGELLRANLLPQAEIHMIRQRRGKWIGQIYLNNKTNATVNYRLKGTPATNAVFELPDPNYDVIPPRRLVPVTIVCREEKGAKCDLGRSPYAYRLEVVFPPLGDQNATHPSTIFKLPFFRCEENVTAMSIP